MKCDNRITSQKVLQTIVRPRAHWYSYKDGEPKCLAIIQLLFEPYLWYLFIITNIMPKHYNRFISYSYCQLIYAIMCGFEIDLAATITYHIRSCIFIPYCNGWFFLVWITRLCLAAGVPIKPNEKRLPPLKPVDKDTARHWCVRDVIDSIEPCKKVKTEDDGTLDTPTKTTPSKENTSSTTPLNQIEKMCAENILMLPHHNEILEQLFNGIKSSLHDSISEKFGVLPPLSKGFHKLVNLNGLSDTSLGNTPTSGAGPSRTVSDY